MSHRCAISPFANDVRSAAFDLLLVLGIAILAGSLARVAVEIADPGGAFGPAPVIFAANARSQAPLPADEDCHCLILDPATGMGSPLLLAQVNRETAKLAEPPRPPGFLAGETAGMRERARRGESTDLRIDFFFAALSIRNPGQGAIAIANGSGDPR